jgi:uncharacterized protein YjbJ (UPF0337 family)
MNWNIVEGKWRELKGSVQTQWGKLTDDDLDEIEGNREKLAGKIQAQYGRTEQEVEREIDEWLARH